MYGWGSRDQGRNNHSGNEFPLTLADLPRSNRGGGTPSCLPRSLVLVLLCAHGDAICREQGRIETFRLICWLAIIWDGRLMPRRRNRRLPRFSFPIQLPLCKGRFEDTVIEMRGLGQALPDVDRHHFAARAVRTRRRCECKAAGGVE